LIEPKKSTLESHYQYWKDILSQKLNN
jgi:hypothetical protein